MAQFGQGASRFRTYLFVNLIFWSFLVAIAVAVYISTGAQWDGVMKSVMKFLFLVVGGGFTLVSIFDAIYDAYYGDDPNTMARLHLLAREVSIPPLAPSKPPIHVTAPPPEHMRDALTACGWREDGPATRSPA